MKFDIEEIDNELKIGFGFIKEHIERIFSYQISFEDDIYVESKIDSVSADGELPKNVIKAIFPLKSSKFYFENIKSLQEFIIKPFIFSIFNHFDFNSLNKWFKSKDFKKLFEENEPENTPFPNYETFMELIPDFNEYKELKNIISEKELYRVISLLILSTYSYNDNFADSIIQKVVHNKSLHPIFFKNQLLFSYNQIHDIINHKEKELSERLFDELRRGTPSSKLKKIVKSLGLFEVFYSNLTEFDFQLYYDHLSELEDIRHHLAHENPTFDFRFFKTSKIVQYVLLKAKKSESEIKDWQLDNESIPKDIRKIMRSLKKSFIELIPYIHFINYVLRLSTFFVSSYAILLSKTDLKFK